MTETKTEPQAPEGQTLQDRIIETMEPGTWYTVRALVDLIGGARSSIRDRLEHLARRSMVKRADDEVDAPGVDPSSLPVYMLMPIDNEGFPRLTPDMVVASAMQNRPALDLAWLSIATPFDPEQLVREYMGESCENV